MLNDYDNFNIITFIAASLLKRFPALFLARRQCSNNCAGNAGDTSPETHYLHFKSERPEEEEEELLAEFSFSLVASERDP
jgi:hypothetical protein